MTSILESGWQSSMGYSSIPTPAPVYHLYRECSQNLNSTFKNYEKCIKSLLSYLDTPAWEKRRWTCVYPVGYQTSPCNTITVSCLEWEQSSHRWVKSFLPSRLHDTGFHVSCQLSLPNPSHLKWQNIHTHPISHSMVVLNPLRLNKIKNPLPPGRFPREELLT